jgi:cytoplasmic iron level regulating protein YaaA (DUF328/UPF0246 family)
LVAQTQSIVPGNDPLDWCELTGGVGQFDQRDRLASSVVFVLLPPSETKAVGGAGPALDLQALRFPGLASARAQLIEIVTTLCADLPAARLALAVSAGKDSEITATAALRMAPTMPALLRYTGVLYEALDAGSLPPSARARAQDRLLITSSMFGMVGAGDAVPAYRLSAGSALPGLPGLPAYWRPHLAAAMRGLDRPLIDLRSGAYAGFAPIADAITVRVVTENASGQRTVVSHFNKATKGLLARALVTSRADIAGIGAVARVARRAGLRVERTGELSLEILT